jgi:hypothetical protein
MTFYVPGFGSVVDVVAQLGMWWLSCGDMVTPLWGCGGSVVGMWWLSCEDVVAQFWGCDGSVVNGN